MFWRTLASLEDSTFTRFFSTFYTLIIYILVTSNIEAFSPQFRFFTKLVNFQILKTGGQYIVFRPS